MHKIVVATKAALGSPFFEVLENRFREGITPSLAIACTIERIRKLW
jgi:hypothetical protein